MTKVTVTLIPAAQQAVNALTEITGLSRVDCINRAVQLYRVLEEEKLAGKTIRIVDEDGSAETLTWGDS